MAQHAPHGRHPNNVSIPEIVGALQNGLRILVVGCPPGTFQGGLERDARIVIWPSTEAAADDGRRLIPREVGAVLITRMLSHDLSRNVRHQATERDLPYNATPVSPGRVNQMLKEAIAALTPKPAQTLVRELALVEKPAPEEAEPNELLQMVDDTIAGLQLLREMVVTRVVAQGKELDELRTKAERYDTMRGLFKE